MNIEIRKFEEEDLEDILQFEKDLRAEESFYGWSIDADYVDAVKRSFHDPKFQNAISFLAYVEGKVVGRIDASLVPSHFDGSMKAYLDWICVIKSYRHYGVAQKLMNTLRSELKTLGIDTMIGLIAANEEAQRFYRSLPDAIIRDEGIWIDIK